MAAGRAEGQTELDLLASDIWSDENTGVALGGRDPVSYFLSSGPRAGRPDHELIWGGVAWWFENEGNLEAFRDAPSVYAPRFGGHAVLALARRSVVPGHVDIWDIWDGQLYLFLSPVNREIWRRDHRGITERAVAVWTERLAARLPELVIKED